MNVRVAPWYWYMVRTYVARTVSYQSRCRAQHLTRLGTRCLQPTAVYDRYAFTRIARMITRTALHPRNLHTRVLTW